MKLSGLERELEKKGRELMRILLQEHLDKLSPSLCEQAVCGSDGIDRPNVRHPYLMVPKMFSIRVKKLVNKMRPKLKIFIATLANMDGRGRFQDNIFIERLYGGPLPSIFPREHIRAFSPWMSFQNGP